MRLKKLLLLPMAILALAAVSAAPAMAQTQYHFLDNGEPIGAGEHMLTFNGPFSFENELGGFACEEVHATVEFTAFEAHVTNFVITGCETTGLLPVFGCELTGPTAATATDLPWTVTPESTSTMDVAGVFIDLPMQSGCAFGADITMKTNSSAHLHLNAVSPGELGPVTLSGTLVTPIGETEVEGDLSPDAEGTITLQNI